MNLLPPGADAPDSDGAPLRSLPEKEDLRELGFELGAIEAGRDTGVVSTSELSDGGEGRVDVGDTDVPLLRAIAPGVGVENEAERE